MINQDINNNWNKYQDNMHSMIYLFFSAGGAFAPSNLPFYLSSCLHLQHNQTSEHQQQQHTT